MDTPFILWGNGCGEAASLREAPPRAPPEEWRGWPTFAVPPAGWVDIQLLISPARGQASADRGGSVSRRDHNQANRRARPPRMGAASQKSSQVYSQLLFGRGPGGGKDSHSRQWRLSMAVFLNRNKRPTAAPIEVAEAFLRKAASLALPHQSPTRFTAGEEEDDEEG